MVRRQTSIEDLAAVPPLRDGDRLELGEFLRRYEAMPDLHGAELLDGVVYMPSPIRFDIHAWQQTIILDCFSFYKVRTPSVGSSAPVTTLMSAKDSPEPDAIRFIKPEHRGAISLEPDGYMHGAPELIAEISGTSIHKDRLAKYPAYERNGVQEFILWNTQREEIAWYRLLDGKYIEMQPDSAGVYRSPAFPGFWIDGFAMLDDDLDKAIRTLDLGLGLASPEHVAFVAELASRKTNS